MDTLGRTDRPTPTYPAYDVLMISQMSFAVLAAIDLVAVQVDVVC